MADEGADVLQGKVSLWKKAWDFLGTERAKNINRAIYNVVLLLAIYFLGTTSMVWTLDQVKVYSDELCNYSSIGRLNATRIGTNFNLTGGFLNGTG